MPEPETYFDNVQEAALAKRVWALTKTLVADPTYQLHVVHDVIDTAWMPWVSRRILYARDWTTYHREMGDVNKQLGTTYTGAEIANVEHFFVAALIGNLGGPAGGIALGGIASAAWDLVISPVRKGISRRGLPTKGDWAHDWKQYSVYDARGTWWGSLHGLRGGVTEPR